MVQRRVGLKKMVIHCLADVAVEGANHTGAERTADPERIANQQHGIADMHRVTVAEFHRRQRSAGVDLKDREIEPFGDEHRLGGQRRKARDVRGDLVGAGDDVAVGRDQARRINDETGSIKEHAPLWRVRDGPDLRHAR
jgi:hypothetical protein